MQYNYFKQTKKNIQLFSKNLLSIPFFIFSQFYILPSQVFGWTNYSNLLEEDLTVYSQNCNDYIQDIYKDKFKIHYKKNEIKEKFKAQYLLPWTKRYSNEELKNILKEQKEILDFHIKNTGYNLNGKMYQPAFMQKIMRNIEYAKFPNIKRKGIIIKDTYIKLMPTCEPMYKNIDDPTLKYPFDTFQISIIYIGEPVLILHQTLDKAWKLIIDSRQNIGWVKTSDIDYIKEETIEMMKDANFIVCTNDNDSVSDKISNEYICKTRLGKLFPLLREDKNFYYILYPVKKETHSVFKNGKLRKLSAEKLPLKFSFQNIAFMANKLIGSRYGWGNIHALRDCSSCLKDIYSIFGIFLPRMSINQKESGIKTDLSQLSTEEKLSKIEKVGVPFLSLIYMPGHIFLYLGVFDKKIMLYHDFWGILSHEEKKKGVLGRVIIMPIDMITKQKYKIQESFIDRITSINFIGKDVLQVKDQLS